MNWLAHVFLSENHIDYQLGNLLADPLKGKNWDVNNTNLYNGFKMHTAIDSFTDSNEFVFKSKSRLREKGYLKGVVIDVAYDFLLLNNWDRYSNVKLDTFIESLYSNANKTIKTYPKYANELVAKIIASKNLTSYATFDGLESAFQRIDKRLSARILAKESTVGYLSDLKENIKGIELDFLQFFPQLIEFFKSSAKPLPTEHWLK